MCEVLLSPAFGPRHLIVSDFSGYSLITLRCLQHVYANLYLTRTPRPSPTTNMVDSASELQSGFPVPDSKLNLKSLIQKQDCVGGKV